MHEVSVTHFEHLQCKESSITTRRERVMNLKCKSLRLQWKQLIFHANLYINIMENSMDNYASNTLERERGGVCRAPYSLYPCNIVHFRNFKIN